MAYSDDVYTARSTHSATITPSSTAAQVLTAEKKLYRGLHIASLKWGVENNARTWLINNGFAPPGVGETA